MSRFTAWHFLAVFLAISVIVCGITFFLLKRRLGLSTQGNYILLGVLGLIGTLMVVGPIEYRMNSQAPTQFLNNVLQYLQYFLMGWVGVTLLTFLFAEIVQNLFLVFAKLTSIPQDPSKRIFLTEGFARGLLTAASVATVGGFIQAEAGARIQPVTIHLPTLPPEFDGLTIAQISDIHIGPILHRPFLQKVVDQVMSINADLIFITGDLVDGTVEQLRELVEPLRQLKARDGIYFCTGNHEYYSGANEWIAHLESMGIQVLKNSNKILTRASAKILIGGVYDWHAGQFFDDHETDPHAAAKTDENVTCKILLAHNPFSIEKAADAGFNLQVSGHTHAGQFYPFVFLVKMKLKHSEGLYRINDKTQLYVNRGTGYWGPPNRLGKWSEITHFTLKS